MGAGGKGQVRNRTKAPGVKRGDGKVAAAERPSQGAAERPSQKGEVDIRDRHPGATIARTAK